METAPTRTNEEKKDERERKRILAIIEVIRPQIEHILGKGDALKIETSEKRKKIMLKIDPDGLQDIETIMKTVAAYMKGVLRGKKIETLQTENEIIIKEEIEEIEEGGIYYEAFRSKSLGERNRITAPIEAIRYINGREINSIRSLKRQGPLLGVFSIGPRKTSNDNICIKNIEIKASRDKKGTTINRLLLSDFLHEGREKPKKVDIYLAPEEDFFIVIDSNPLETEKEELREKIKKEN